MTRSLIQRQAGEWRQTLERVGRTLYPEYAWNVAGGCAREAVRVGVSKDGTNAVYRIHLADLMKMERQKKNRDQVAIHVATNALAVWERIRDV